MVDHNHTTRVPGCFRCDLSADEVADDYTPTTEEVRDCYATGGPCGEELRQRLERKFRDDYAEFDRWLAAHDAGVRRDEREKVAAEIEALKPALTQWIAAYETHDAAVWAESPEEGAADLVERIARVVRGGAS